MSRKKKISRKTLDAANKAGGNYILDQIQSTYFKDWMWDQMVEAEEMRKRDPDSVIPLESPSDFRKVARNMLQQLGWDIKRELRPYDVEKIVNDDSPEAIQAFHDGMEEKLHDPNLVNELVSEIMTIHEQIQESNAPKEEDRQVPLPGVHARETRYVVRTQRQRPEPSRKPIQAPRRDSGCPLILRRTKPSNRAVPAPRPASPTPPRPTTRRPPTRPAIRRSLPRRP